MSVNLVKACITGGLFNFGLRMTGSHQKSMIPTVAIGMAGGGLGAWLSYQLLESDSSIIIIPSACVGVLLAYHFLCI